MTRKPAAESQRPVTGSPSRRLVTGLLLSWLMIAIAAPSLTLLMAQELRQPDPSGAATGAAADVAAAEAGAPAMEEIAAQVGKNKVGINMMWVLLTGFIVMFMQA